ncbi:MAG TPA: helix-turn-helix transcriptional regulator [Solirubrobacteraceae bacterium]|jgi:transcriptional regulator with XRE-family HTH domain|nr:helix-turn-helix transcriptional regulator [Solirubrobacteraceae bacterium]
MFSANLIIEARRRSGLTQRELATRAGVRQQEIARYERGRVTPSLERLRQLIAACDLELTLGLARADTDHDRAIARALAMPPARRLARALRKAAEARRSQTQRGEDQQPRDPIGVLRILNESGMSYVLIGELAELLRASPLLPGGGSVTIVPGANQQQPLLRAIVAGRGLGTHGPSNTHEAVKRWNLDAFGTELVVVPAPAGTGGYRDLRRDATTLQIDKGLDVAVAVAVASLVDLVRIGEAAGDRARTHILRRTLEVTTGRRTPPERPIRSQPR